jgi:putative transposase
MSATPKSSVGWVKALLHSIYDQPDAEAVHAQFDRVVDALGTRNSPPSPTTSKSPRRHPRVHRVPQGDLASDLVEQPQRAAQPRDPPRTDVVGIFPDRASIIRLVGAVLAEQHDEWAEGRRYLGVDVLARAQAVDHTIVEEVTEPELQALTA